MRTSLHSLPTALAFAGFLLAGCHPSTPTTPAGRKPDAVPVTVATVNEVSWDRTVSIVGTLYAKDTALIGAQVEGEVESTLVDFGDRVKSGQDLAWIDTATHTARLQQAAGARARAEANVANARHNFDRIKQLRQTSIASEADYDQAEAQYQQCEADLKATQGTEAVAKLDLEHSRVTAPFDGAIAQRFVGRGDYAKTGTPLFELVNDAVLKFIFPVPERYASRVVKRLPVSFNVDNYPGETFRGSVYLISPQVTTTSRAFSVGALVTNTGFRLKANTFARGELTVESGTRALVAPLESVVSFAGVTKVFVVEGAVVKAKTVTLGRVRDGLQEFLTGVKAGEQVVITGQSKLSDGTSVAVGPPAGRETGGKASPSTGTDHGSR